MSSLTYLRGRVTAVGIVIVLVLVAGVWIAMTHASAKTTASARTDSRSQHHKAAADPPLRVLSVTPASHATAVNGAAPIKIKFSAPLAKGTPLPTVEPKIAGSWHGAGTDSLSFVPAVGFTQYSHVTVQIPGGTQGIQSASGGVLSSSVTVKYRTRGYSTARLDQLLAQLGYLPLSWTASPGASVPASSDAAAQLAAAYNPPQGQFSWDSGYPSELQSFWDSGSKSGLIVQGAVMAFESEQGLAMDGVAGREVWRALLRAAAAHQSNPNGYTYAIADESNPETLTIWHNGQQVQHSLANTGIQAAPTTIGTAPVYLRYRNQIMRGTNPNGTKYADPVQFVAYFRSGEAVHYFPRGSYGFPQSLGCVELDLSDAQHAWPYLTYGSLVTVERGALTPAGSPTAG